MTPNWTVIIVAKGMWPTTEQCLLSLLATTRKDQVDEIIYNDNDTPPEEDSWVRSREWEDQYRNNVIMCRYSYSYPASLSEIWNFAIGSVSRNDKILLCNNDMIFHKCGWLDELEAGLSEPGVGAVGLIGMSWRDTPFIQGALLGFTKKVFNEVGEFDLRYPFTCEDVDWCKRLQEKGYGIKSFEHLRDDGSVQHLEGATRNYYKDSVKEYQRLAHISRLEYCYKHTYPSISIHD